MKLKPNSNSCQLSHWILPGIVRYFIILGNQQHGRTVKEDDSSWNDLVWFMRR